MKKILAILFLCLSFTNVFAGKIDKMIFFGDSLSDPGHLYKLLMNVLPKSPPYYEGRFSNGPTWAEHVGQYFYSEDYTDSSIYALGGATAVFHMPTTKFISPTTLALEVDKYLWDTVFTDRSKVLFVIWIGGNDYLYDKSGDAETATQPVVDKIASSIMLLKKFGAKHFLVLNLPDLSKTPFAKEHGTTANLYAMTILHNEKLDAAITDIQTAYPDISINLFDVFTLLNDVMNNPKKYNHKYHINLTDLENACWTGGYIGIKNMSEQSMADEIAQAITAKNTSLPKGFDTQVAGNFIANSPELSYAFAMGKSYERGNVPCANPGEHMFWDDIHPTAVIHRVLAQIVEDAIGPLN